MRDCWIAHAASRPRFKELLLRFQELSGIITAHKDGDVNHLIASGGSSFKALMMRGVNPAYFDENATQVRILADKEQQEHHNGVHDQSFVSGVPHRTAVYSMAGLGAPRDHASPARKEGLHPFQPQHGGQSRDAQVNGRYDNLNELEDMVPCKNHGYQNIPSSGKDDGRYDESVMPHVPRGSVISRTVSLHSASSHESESRL